MTNLQAAARMNRPVSTQMRSLGTNDEHRQLIQRELQTIMNDRAEQFERDQYEERD